MTLLPERRQVTALVIRREVTEYRTVAGVCGCGQTHRSAWPDGVSAPVQFGPGVSALAVYLTQYQLLPYQRSVTGNSAASFRAHWVTAQNAVVGSTVSAAG